MHGKDMCAGLYGNEADHRYPRFQQVSLSGKEHSPLSLSLSLDTEHLRTPHGWEFAAEKLPTSHVFREIFQPV